MERQLERFNLPVLILAGIAIFLYLLELFRLIPEALRVPMMWINFLIDFVFLLDILAKSIILKAKYLKSPWFLVDFVSTMPIISSAMEIMGAVGPQLEATRAARAARVARVARTARLAKVARAARVATAVRSAQGLGFLKGTSEEQETPAFNRALVISVPLLLAVFMTIAYFVTEQQIGQLTTHLSRQLEMAQTPEDIVKIPEYLDASQAGDPRIEKIFLTKEFDGRLVEYPFSAVEAHAQADWVQGLLLVFTLLTVAGVVYMSSSLSGDQVKEEEDSILRQFLSPAIVDKFETNPEVVERFSNYWLSVFFVTLKGGTQTAEGEADDLEAVVLQRRQVVDVIRNTIAMEYNGIVDKFIGDTVMGWIGGPFSTQWTPVSSLRERLALDELAFADQDIKSISRQLAAVEHGSNGTLTNDEADAGLPSGREARIRFLTDTLREVEANRAALLEKQQTAKNETPDLEARHDEAFRTYKREAAKSAVLCCLAILEEVAKQASDDGGYSVSIGMTSGSVSVGNFGSTDQIGFTALGPTVDRSAELELAASQYGCRLLIDLDTHELIKETPDLQFRALPPVAVSGSAEPLVVYEPFKPGTVSQEFLYAFHEGVFAVQRREFEQARSHFEKANQLRDGGDRTSQLWIEECRAATRDGHASSGA